MSLTPEERAALERRLGFEHYYEMERGDSKRLAAALLRLCPADGDLPIDEAFLRSLGFKDWEHDILVLPETQTATLATQLGCKRIAGTYCAMIRQAERSGVSLMDSLDSNDRIDTVAIAAPTRGQLRSLAASLGIELREGK